MTLTKKTNALLWALQALLAALFLFAGVTKLMMPAEALAAQSTLPVGFLRFIGAAEFLGAVGLILPQLLNIRPELTPLAAAGLAIIMAGATVISAATVSLAGGITPLIIGLLCAYIVERRCRALRSVGLSEFSKRVAA